MSDRAMMPDSYDLDMTRWEPGDQVDYYNEDHDCQAPPDEHIDDHIDSDAACPSCGEDLLDQLVWIAEDLVECQSCGHQYTPGVEPREWAEPTE